MPQGADPRPKRDRAEDGADESTDDDAEGQDGGHVDAAGGGDEDDEVGEGQPGRMGVGAERRLGQVGALEGVDDEGGDGRGQDDAEVDPKFIAHATALGACGGDGSVGDEREVVAKEGPARNDGRDVLHGKAERLGESEGDGHEGDNGADARSDGEGDDAGGEEEARQEQSGGQQAEDEVNRSVDGADALGGLGEGARQDEDPDHHQQIVVRHAA